MFKKIGIGFENKISVFWISQMSGDIIERVQKIFLSSISKAHIIFLIRNEINATITP